MQLSLILADREVQRILLELLNQMDGFDQTVNVKVTTCISIHAVQITSIKVIMATNRHDTLDPALLRPGRLDRKIEFPMPDRRQKRLVFSTITAKMNLSEEIDLEDCIHISHYLYRVSFIGGRWFCPHLKLKLIMINLPPIIFFLAFIFLPSMYEILKEILCKIIYFVFPYYLPYGIIKMLLDLIKSVELI